MFDINHILSLVGSVLLVLVATVLHEVAHGATANALGDDTAKRMGRITLNPFKHLDLVGSVVLPLLMALVGGPIFAFAKPVPYDPRKLKHPVRDEVLVALAGPACNLLQACIGAGVFRGVIAYLTHAGIAYPIPTQWEVALDIIATFVYLNLMLMFFNLIPLPPLDGSAIISPLLRGRARDVYYTVQRNSMPVLLALLYLLPMVLHINPVSTYLNATAKPLAVLLLGF